MADLVDELGNPIRLIDVHGNPVQLTDEYGNPIHVTGVATTKNPATNGAQMAESETSAAAESQQQQQQHRPPPLPPHYEEIQPSNISNTSSFEDDGMGVTRKKDEHKDKLEDILTGGNHEKEEGQSQATIHATKTAVKTTTSTTTPPVLPYFEDEHEEQCLREKIKAKLPWS